MHPVKDRSRSETKGIREPLCLQKEFREGWTVPQPTQTGFRGALDASKEPSISEEHRTRHRSARHDDEHRSRSRAIPNSSPGRNAWPLTDFHTSPEDGRDSPESPATVEVGEMSDLDSVSTRIARRGGDGQGSGERARSAHAESLADRELVAKRHLKLPRPTGQETASDLLGDRQRLRHVGLYLDRGAARGSPFRGREYSRLENQSGSHRSSRPGIAGPESRRKYSGHMGRREGPSGSRSVRGGHSRPSLGEVLKAGAAPSESLTRGHSAGVEASER